MATKNVTEGAKQSGFKYPTFYQRGKGGVPDNWFAVPAENHQDGRVSGIKALREILDTYKEGSKSDVILWRIVKDLGTAMQEKGTKKDRHAAAWWFVAHLSDTLTFFANNTNYGKWLDSQLAEAQRSKARADAEDAKEKAEFVRRMKEAQAARERSRINDALCAGGSV